MGLNPAVKGRILYVTLHSKSNFTSITKLSILRWGKLSWIIWSAQWNHKRPYKRKARESRSYKDNVMTEGEREREREGNGFEVGK